MFAFIYFFLCVVGAVIGWWLYFISTRFYRLCIKIPGPQPLPIIGNNYQFSLNPKLFLRNILKLSLKYQPMCRIFIGNACFVMLHDADHVHTVLHSNKTLSKYTLYVAVEHIIGHSVLTAERHEWKRLRRILNPGFNTNIIRSYVDTFNRNSRTLVNVLSEKANAQIFDIHDAMMLMAIDSIVDTGYGASMNLQERKRLDVLEIFKKLKELVQVCALNPVYWYKFIYKHSAVAKEASKFVDAAREFTNVYNFRKEYGENHSTDHNSDEATGDESRKMGFIDHAFKYMRKNNEAMSEEELENQIRVLGAAGSETTAFTMSVCIMLLGLYKEVQDKVVQELREVFGDDVRRPVEYADLQKMNYAEQVIKETMRLFPVAFITGRRADEDIEIGGYLIPAGTNIIISPYHLHRNPIYFPEPEKFDPDRFSPAKIHELYPRCFIPFLAGPRNCIGHYYAMLQMKTVLCHVLRNFEILPCGSREEMEEIDMQLFLSLKHGYNVRIRLM